MRIEFSQSSQARQFLLGTSLLFPVLIAVACWIDKTLSLLGSGKGLSQHYGFWAIFVTTPFIILLTSRLADRFSAAIQETDRYCIDSARRSLDRLVHRHLRRLSFQTQSSWITMFVAVFSCFWWLNVLNTIDPYGTYGHDVFDSYSHPYGFNIAKAYLLFVFGVVYSSAAFVAVRVTLSMIGIFKCIWKHNILSPNLFDIDNCGGMSKFGDVNLIILSIYITVSATTLTMYLTHSRTYLVMTALLLVNLILATAQSWIAVYYISRAVAKERRDSIDAVTVQLNAQLSLSQEGGQFASDLLALRNHLIKIRTFPYAIRVLPYAASILIFLLNLLSFAAVEVAVMGYIEKALNNPK